MFFVQNMQKQKDDKEFPQNLPWPESERKSHEIIPKKTELGIMRGHTYTQLHTFHFTVQQY